MGTELEEFQKLMAEWQLAKEAASMAQLAVDLKMTAYLKEGSQPPTRKEMERIDELQSIECEKRDAVDCFICDFAI